MYAFKEESGIWNLELYPEFKGIILWQNLLEYQDKHWEMATGKIFIFKKWDARCENFHMINDMLLADTKPCASATKINGNFVSLTPIKNIIRRTMAASIVQ
jgi:hypothetical protein